MQRGGGEEVQKCILIHERDVVTEMMRAPAESRHRFDLRTKMQGRIHVVTSARCIFGTYVSRNYSVQSASAENRTLALSSVSFDLVWAIHPMTTISITLRHRQVGEPVWDHDPSIKLRRLLFSDETTPVCSPRRSPSGSTRPCVAAVFTSGVHAPQSPPPP